MGRQFCQLTKYHLWTKGICHLILVLTETGRKSSSILIRHLVANRSVLHWNYSFSHSKARRTCTPFNVFIKKRKTFQQSTWRARRKNTVNYSTWFLDVKEDWSSETQHTLGCEDSITRSHFFPVGPIPTVIQTPNFNERSQDTFKAGQSRRASQIPIYFKL